MPTAQQPLYIDYRTGTIRGPAELMGRLFAPARGYFYGPPQATLVISNPQRLHRIVARLRALGYRLIETPSPPASPCESAETAPD